MKDWRSNSIPYLIPVGVLVLVLGLHLLPQSWPIRELLERLEAMTYDWRVGLALRKPPPVPVATNLGAILITEGDLENLNSQPQRFYWPLPRFMHAQVVRYLADSGAKAIAMDVLFLDRHPDASLSVRSLGATNTSDGHLAAEMARAGNVLLPAGSPGEMAVKGGRIPGMPLPLLATNAAAICSISKTNDHDGVLRRLRAFDQLPDGRRNWQVGLAMGARALGLDLDRPEFLPGKIVLHSADGKVSRTIPVQRDNTFLVDWYIPLRTSASAGLPQLKSFFGAGFGSILDKAQRQLPTDAAPHASPWKDRLVFITSAGIGANVRDIGPSPLAPDTPLPAAHWNVANSLLTGVFVQRAPTELDLLLIALMTIVAGWISWRVRALYSSVAIALIALAYTWACVQAYVRHRYWLPVVMPIGGALLMTHVVMVAYRAYVERAQQRHLRSTFGKIVAPDILDLLLRDEHLPLAASRQDVGILFADIRAFTAFTDQQQDRALERIKHLQLESQRAQRVLDEVARETMDTVNHYLGLIAEHIKSHQGTLDKYIGDSVMAFWGAPTPISSPVARCVHSAISIQRAVAGTNADRRRENARRETENLQRQQTNQPPLPALHLFEIGIGINAGPAGVGFMGSPNHISNYTVFGREVNIASRVEGHATGGQILITDATLAALRQEDPALAARCRELPPINVKGIARPVPVHEVPWQETLSAPGSARQ